MGKVRGQRGAPVARRPALEPAGGHLGRLDRAGLVADSLPPKLLPCLAGPAFAAVDANPPMCNAAHQMRPASLLTHLPACSCPTAREAALALVEFAQRRWAVETRRLRCNDIIVAMGPYSSAMHACAPTSTLRLSIKLQQPCHVILCVSVVIFQPNARACSPA